jgi:outer membrane protein TolC
MRKLSALRAALVLTSGIWLHACAQAQPANPDSTLLAILNGIQGSPLSLQEATQLSLQNAPSVRSAEAAYHAALGAVRRESGVFDPQLSLAWDYADQQIPSASFFAGATVLRNLQGTGSVSLNWALPTGTSIDASLGAVRLNTNSTFAFLNPQYTTLADIELRQPLLRGFTVSARKALSGAEQDMDAARFRYDQEVLSTGTRVELLYWDLYAVERDYAVQVLTRDRAAAFLKETQLRASTGLIGPNQVANARTFLAEQEILLLDKEEQLDAASDQMAALIGIHPDSIHMRFVATDQPPDNLPLPDMNRLVAEARERNLTLLAARADIESRRTQARAASWESLPKLDLVAGLGGNGLAGTAQDVIFGTDTLRTGVGGQFGDALRQAIKRDFPIWHIGLEANIPIGFRTGLGEEDRLEAELVIAEQRYELQNRILEAAIRESCRELMHGQRRLDAAREGVAAAQEQVRIGLIEFQNGRSTAFELVRLGADFAVAQQRYSQALVRSAKAAASLHELTSAAYSNR